MNKIPTLKIGDKDTNGKKITAIYCNAPEYIIYETGDFLRWVYESSASDHYNRVFARVSEIGCLVTDKNEKRRWINAELARALEICFEGHPDTALSILETILDRIIAKRNMATRVAYLLSASIFVLINTLLCIITKVKAPHLQGIFGKDILYLFYTATLGSFGGIISIILRMKDLDIDQDSGGLLNVMNGLSRIFIAMVCSIIVYFSIKSNIFLGVLNNINSYFLIYSIAIASGFGERLIPNVLKNTKPEKHVTVLSSKTTASSSNAKAR